MDLRRVDLNLLVILDQVLHEGHVTRASVALSMSQPAVSNAVNRLRRLLGDPLLVRAGRSVKLTPFAESLKPKIRAVLTELEQTLTARPTFDASSDERTFTIAATDYMTVILLRSVIESLAVKAPNVRIVVIPVQKDYEAQLREDREDLIFMPVSSTVGTGTADGEHLFFDHFVLAMWRQHPRVDEEPETLLREEPYLAWRPQGSSAFYDHLQEMNILLRKDVRLESLMTVPFVLSGTRLVTIIHERLATKLKDATDLVTKQLPAEVSPVSQRMFWHPRRSEDAGHIWLRSAVLQAASELSRESSIRS